MYHPLLRFYAGRIENNESCIDDHSNECAMLNLCDVKLGAYKAQAFS